MALTTSTSAASHILAKFIEQSIRESLNAALVLPRMITQADLRGKNSKTWSTNVWPSLTAAAVAESADLVAQEVALSANDITVSEVGLSIDVTDFSTETSNVTPEAYAQQGTIALAQKIESDIAALFSGLATTVGATGTDLSLDTMINSIQALETANVHGPKWMVLHPRQIGTLRRLIAGSSGSTASFYSTGAVNPAISTIPGFVTDFLGVPVFQSTHTPKVNANADYCGALFTADAFGMATLRDVRVEPERNASARVTEMNITAAYGVGELRDICGVRIISKVAA